MHASSTVRPTLKHVERFRKNRELSVLHQSYLDVSERTFMSEPIENHAISKLFNVNVNNRRRRFRE